MLHCLFIEGIKLMINSLTLKYSGSTQDLTLRDGWLFAIIVIIQLLTHLKWYGLKK